VTATTTPVATTGPTWSDRVQPVLVYALVTLVGIAAFLYPFWLPTTALPDQAHAGDAPLVAGVVGALALTALFLEVRRGTMTAMTVAVLGVLAAAEGLLRLVALPLGNNAFYFFVILAGVAFGPRFGLLLGLMAMAVSAVITGGIGPWLPFQMLTLAWLGATAGLLGIGTRRLRPRAEVWVLAVFGWCWGFFFGAIMNFWFWPFQRDGGDLSWVPGSGIGTTLRHYWSFYVATSVANDAARALPTCVLILVTGTAVLRTLRRFAHRLDPVAEFVED
jgi:energy-coupling factor transport system substrate-specific component